MRNLILITMLSLGLTAAASSAALDPLPNRPQVPLVGQQISASTVNSQWHLPRPPSGASLPLEGRIVGEFDPPAQRWMAGHRGVDISGNVGSPIHAAASGTVAFAGVIAGRPVISIDHGGVRTTYEPVQPNVAEGEKVSAGQVIGTLEGGHCAQAACLHWGAKRGKDVYLDPRLFLHSHSVLIGPNPAYEHSRR